MAAINAILLHGNQVDEIFPLESKRFEMNRVESQSAFDHIPNRPLVNIEIIPDSSPAECTIRVLLKASSSCSAASRILLMRRGIPARRLDHQLPRRFHRHRTQKTPHAHRASNKPPVKSNTSQASAPCPPPPLDLQNRKRLAIRIRCRIPIHVTHLR
jgi:hypothetical protein